MTDQAVKKRGPRYKDLTDQRFGKLTALTDAGRSKRGGTLWLCRCDCGETCTVAAYNLASGHTQSCGCLRGEVAAAQAPARITHGMTRSPEYVCWVAMIQRCTNQKHEAFEYYGGRGIAVCARWRGSFEAFYEDMGPRPSLDYSLDRHPDGDGDYEPGNVRWATTTEQNRNRAVTRMITVEGETRSLVDWCEMLRLPQPTVRARIRSGWTPTEALGLQERDRHARRRDC